MRRSDGRVVVSYNIIDVNPPSAPKGRRRHSIAASTVKRSTDVQSSPNRRATVTIASSNRFPNNGSSSSDMYTRKVPNSIDIATAQRIETRKSSNQSTSSVERQRLEGKPTTSSINLRVDVSPFPQLGNAPVDTSKKVTRPKSASCRRPNPMEKRPPEEYFFNARGASNRDDLIREQDLAVSRHKLKQVDPQSPTWKRNSLQNKARSSYEWEYKTPALVDREKRNGNKEKSVLQRERFESKTSGGIVNNKLPFHEYLNEYHDPAIVTDGRWCSSVKLENSTADWARPIVSKPSKSRDAFQYEYHAEDIKKAESYDGINVLKSVISL